LPVGPEQNYFIFKGLNLYEIRQVFVTLRGYNRAGLSTDVISNGVFISRYSAGFPPFTPFSLNDGLFDNDMQV
jgi:hypothetical protein